jgi:hypothetical protein
MGFLWFGKKQPERKRVPPPPWADKQQPPKLSPKQQKAHAAGLSVAQIALKNARLRANYLCRSCLFYERNYTEPCPLKSPVLPGDEEWLDSFSAYVCKPFKRKF